MLFSPRTNVESKQAKTPESKIASHHAGSSVKWDYHSWCKMIF